MYKFKMWTFLAGLFIAVMLLLAACGADEPTPSEASEVPRISSEDLKERLDNGEAIVVADTRVPTVYSAKHISGAISVPFSEVELHLDEWPRDQEIVFYCA